MPERRFGGFRHLVQALEYAARFPQQALCYFDATGQLSVSTTYLEVLQKAHTAALFMRQQVPLAPGQRVGILAQTGPDFLVQFCACHILGLVPCPMPMPTPMQAPERYRQLLAGMQSAAGISLLLGPQQALALLAHGTVTQSPDTIAFEAVDYDQTSNVQLTPWEPGVRDIAYVQFSSGSTAQPKGIAISHQALMRNVGDILNHGMELTTTDRAFSWLPYYHDMGLVGFVLAPLCGQVSVDYLAPAGFARRPHLWLSLMGSRSSTITYAPGFAYALAAQRHAAVDPGVRLDALRIAGVGGDRVYFAQLQEFAARYAPQGFDPNAFKPSYGLAEATLAVSMSHTPFAQWSQAAVDCGNVLSGWQLTVRGAGGQSLPPGAQGDIVVQGPAQMAGTFLGGVFQPWPAEQGIDTGDTGFVTPAGVLFITGRKKDLIIVRGRNIWPQDVEDAVSTHTGMADEDMLLLQDSRDEQQGELVLLIHEKALRKCALRDAAEQASAIAAARLGTQPRVCVVANGSITYTSSGKKARAPTRARFESGAIAIRPPSEPTVPGQAEQTHLHNGAASTLPAP